MAALVLLVLLSAFVGGSDATWCVCRSDVSQVAQQKTLDYACGAGADCTPVSQNGACYSPNTVLAHCSYAANSYFQRKGQAAGTCDFSGTATITATDPSYSTCSFPSSVSTAGTATTTPVSGTPAGTTTTGTPSTFTPNTNGVLGGLGPSGGLSTDTTAAAAATGVVSLTLPVVTVLAGVALLRLHW
ncbi:hypothetical protein Taro_049745 [Colocasia esculenta]|uniref:X8 domain-containing protein n=1 Tax=Colocasia esculenta TaxID=4460 RepID=A0A843XBV9_COLES|nr:hypothetical protein [Colocasia esculenta]